jgi:hypothetical protein
MLHRVHHPKLTPPRTLWKFGPYAGALPGGGHHAFPPVGDKSRRFQIGRLSELVACPHSGYAICIAVLEFRNSATIWEATGSLYPNAATLSIADAVAHRSIRAHIGTP